MKNWKMIAGCSLLLLSLMPPLGAGEPKRNDEGARIYKQKCVRCHGAEGKGNEDVAPFSGMHDLTELAQVIAETMPEDDPEQCVGKEAQAAAQYVLGKFFKSAEPTHASRPPIELARLTVRQYRQAIADLGTVFAPRAAVSANRGLRATYFNHRRFRRDKEVLKRIDPSIDFDFGDGSPEKKIGKEEFSIQWRGSLIAPDTGEYEINVRADNGFRIWLNDMAAPLIDAWVRSGDAKDHRATIFLIGGRRYPLRLEFFKHKDKTAAIHLLWKRPRRAEQVIAREFLCPEDVPPVLIASVPFPPDDRSYGYERGSRISDAWQRAVMQGAIETAETLVASMPHLLKEKKNEPSAVKDLGYRFVERAFRRPLDPETRKRHVDDIVDSAPDMQAALKRIVIGTLMSPTFLYRETSTDGFDDFDIASRLSFVLWDSLPDPWLIEQASKGALHTPDQIRAAAGRMIEDPRTRSKLRVFYYYWLRLDRLEDVTKDAELYPGFDQQLVSDLRTSLYKFLDRVTWEEPSSDFRQLLVSEFWYANKRLADWYGGKAANNLEFVWQERPNHEAAAGVLTHPFLLSGLGYHKSSSPIHRGVFIARGILGRRLKVPPIAVAPLSADLKPELTTRERVELQTKPTACRTCHDLINPLGFPLESFDGVGRYRVKEKGKKVDASGWVLEADAEKVKFYGPRDLAVYMAGSPETHRAFVQQVFHELVKQPILAFGLKQPERLTEQFVSNQFNIRKLLHEVAVTSDLPQNQHEPRQPTKK